MFNTTKKTLICKSSFNSKSFPARRAIAQALAFLLLMQAIVPPAIAAERRPISLTSLASLKSRKDDALRNARGTGGSTTTTARPVVQTTTVKLAVENFGIELTPLDTPFTGHTGIDYHQPTRQLIVSANFPAGQPANFESLAPDGTHRPFSNLAGLNGELRIATARTAGQGLSLGGFKSGELFTGTNTPGVIARVSADGASVQNPWVTLPGESGELQGGLFVDRTGVFGGDLIAVTTAGGVWRVTSAGVAARIATLDTALQGLTTIPDDVAKYGPWAGKILVCAKERGVVYTVDAQGGLSAYDLGIIPQDIHIVPAHENFYGVDSGEGKILGAPDDAFTGIIGDVLVAQGNPGLLMRVHWNGTEFEVGRVAQAAQWGQITFAPAGLAQVLAVKQVYDKIAIVRHAPQLNSGRVEGALWQLTGESLALDGTDVITSDLLVPGTPNVTIGSGKPTFGGVIAGVESTQPSNYSISIGNNASLRHVVTRTDAINLTPVAAPPAPTGTREVSLTRAGESAGDFSTLRNLSLSGRVGSLVVPPGTYGKFALSGRTTLVLGVENSTQPSVYNLEELTLAGGSELRLAGPVALTVKGNVSLVGSTLGAPNDSSRLLLKIAQGALDVSGTSVLYGIVRIPQGTVAIEGNGRVRGTVMCDRLHIAGNGVLQITENDVPLLPINRPPTVDAGPDQAITLPVDAVSLNGTATDDGLPSGSTLTTLWSKVSGPGTVSFSDSGNAVTTATFGEPGTYVLRLRASDSLLTTADEITVTVVPRNQPPVVNAGADQTVELPNTVPLSGTVTDDALPRGSTVTSTWSKVSGPGTTTFSDPAATSTTVSFSAPGTYTLRLTATDTEFSVGDEVLITVYPENQPPTANAGTDQTIKLPAALTLNGAVSDDGYPFGSALTSTWTKVSGPGTVTFANPAAPVTQASFSVEGTYVLRLSASDTLLTASDECTVTVQPANLPPIVNAGLDQEITFLETAAIKGTATDDGLPVGSALEVAWSVASGPGAVTFSHPEQLDTSATFAAPGTYVLRLTGTDTQFTASDEATVVVKPRPNASRVYTTDADFDQGNLINLTHPIADQLQLDSTTRSFNFIWVAVSTKGTVVKINTETGAIIGEYFTSPSDQPKDPSRTTVDLNGNVWATNRAGNSVVHIGLVENGQCVDRNNNGVIDTSTGFNDIRPWVNTNGANTNGGVTLAQDECILHYTKVNSFGTRHVSVNKDNDVWVSGTSGQRFDLIDGKTGLIKRAEPSVGYGGYGGLIDRNGVIWSANPLLRWDTSKPLSGASALNGMAFTLNGGRATWDKAGASSTQPQSERVWVEDITPAGAGLAGDGEFWNWITANPTPFSGTVAHQSNINNGTHQHYFTGASDTLSVGENDSLFTYVYLDPANPPRQVMLQWNNGNWEHRAYWGQSVIPWGVEGTESRRHMGPLPALGQWVRLEVPASQVGLASSGTNWRGYSHPSYGLCIDSKGNVWNTSYGNGTIRKFSADGTLLATFNQGFSYAQGCVIDRNDDVWVAHSLNGSTVGHLKNNGTYVGTVQVQSGPTGVAVDGAGKVWATNYYSGTVSRINPQAGPIGADGVTRVGAVDFTTPYLGGNPYNYSDMTGSTLTGAPRQGTWSTVFDSQIAGAEWGRIGWTAQVCGDGLLSVSVATSTDGTNFGQPLTVDNGADPSVPNGRYIKITVRMERASSGESPVLYDLSVGTVGFPLPGQTNSAPGVNAGDDQTLNGITKTTLRGSACDDALLTNQRLSILWTKVSGPGTVTFSSPTSTLTDATFSAPGTYNLRLTASDSVLTNGDVLTVTVVPGNQSPSVNAGADQAITLPASATLAGTATDDGLPAGSTLTTTWNKLSGPGLVTFVDAHQLTTRASFSAAGTYVLRLEGSDTEKGAFDDVTITVTPEPVNQPPVVNAGADQAVTLPHVATLNGTATDDAQPAGSGLTVSWSIVSAPGPVSFAAPSNPSTTAAFSESGTYVLRLTASDTKLSASDDVVVNVVHPNRAPTVAAGADQAITLPGAARLSGDAGDDGLPAGSDLSVSWSKVSGPGAVSFTNPNAAVTNATFSVEGIYVLRLSAGDSQLISSDDVTVQVNPVAPNQSPVVNAGAGQSIGLGVNLVQNPGNDDPLVNNEIRGWTEVIGSSWTQAAAGSVGFPDSLNGGSYFYAGATGTAELLQDIDVTAFAATIAGGNQSFEWKAYARSREEHPADTARIILEYRNASNTAPLARLDSGEITSTNAWALLEDTRPAPAGTGWIRIRLISTRNSGTTNDSYFDGLSLRAVSGAGAKLNGTVADDGLPSGGQMTSVWTKVSGPGTVAFQNAAAASTSAVFGEAGTYVLRLTANDSELETSREVTITIESRNQAPGVDAGADQTVTLPDAATLTGTVSDDGKPLGSAVSTLWSKVSGPGTVTFGNAGQAATTVSFSASGTYVLKLTAGDTDYTSSDVVSITVNPVAPNRAPLVNAGADQVVSPPDNAAELSGSATDDGKPAAALAYAWSKVSGPGTVTFSSPTRQSTRATFSAAGVYIIRLSVNDSELTGFDDVAVTLNGVNQTPTVNAGADLSVPHPTNVNLQGAINDDGLPLGSTVSAVWSKVSGPGTVAFGNAGQAATTASFSAPGIYVLKLTANDSALSATDEVTVTQSSPPAVGISSPSEGATITGRTDFVGTVSEGSTWRLEYSLNEAGGAPTWTTFSSGHTPVNNGLLGTFDPTLLLNGIYTVRLVATNPAGQISTTSLDATVEGEQKVGNFSISFTDLSIPMAGVPIEAVRTYDSRDKRQGDFGVGWNLGVRNLRLQETGEMGLDWEATVIGGFFPSYCLRQTKPHLITITMPGGEVYKFEPTLGPQCSTLYPMREVTLGFRALPGTFATLTPVGETTVFVAASFPGTAMLLDYSTLDPKDFSQYQLTLPNGDVYHIDERDGLRKMTDANGNTLTINSGGISHSSGKSISFVRDAQGRITQITDPAGASMSYGYNASGDLVSFKDRENNETTFTYNSSHGLLTIKDPRGIQPVRNEYDNAGRLVRQIDALGKAINFLHDSNTRQEVTTDRLGHTTVYEYNARGNVVRVTDARGNIVTRTYDSKDNLLNETNALGQTTGYAYDANGNRTAQTDPLGNTTRYTYNGRNQATSVTDPQGRITLYNYDANGNLTSVKDPLGKTTTVAYNTKGQQTSYTDQLGNVVSFEYNSAGNLTKQTNQLGHVTTYTYDANNNRLSESATRTVGGVQETLTTTYQYSKLNRPTKTIYPDGATEESIYNSVGKLAARLDRLGRRTTYTYDGLGRLTATTYPDGSKNEFAYDAEGRRTKSTDRAGRATTYTYDPLGRLEKTAYPDGTSIATTYNGVGQVVATADSHGNTTHYAYDAAGRRSKVTDALGNVSALAYDANGNQTSLTDARGLTTHYEYDAFNRLVKTIYPDGTTQLATYDALGQLTTKTDQAGRTTNLEYDRRGKLTKVTDALGSATRYTYDEAGNPLTQTDANQHTTSYEYDRQGRRARRTLALGMSETYNYDAAGNLTSRTDFRGKQTTYAYNLMNQLVSKTPDASLNEPAITFTYTPTGRRATMTDASGTTTYVYNSRDRLTSKATPFGTLTYAYDVAGRVLTVRSSNADGVSLDYTYDAASRLATVRDNRQANGTTSYAYDPNGNLSNTLYPNGVQTGYAYNSLNRLTQLTSTGATTLASYTYTLGAAGNRLSVAEADGRTVQYAYEGLYRLTSEAISNDGTINGTLNYTYDAVGNRLTRTSGIPNISSTTSTFDANDRAETDTFNPNGNTIASNGTTYGYDFENRLTSAGDGALTYLYDGDGHRVGKTVGGLTTHFLVDTNNHTGYAQVVEELQGGAVVKQYSYGHDLISQRQRIDGQWTTSFYGYDGHGSVRYLTDPNGVATDTFTYDAFGNLIERTGNTPNSYLYSGEQYDANIGFYYLRARYMNPSSGRFQTMDPHEGSISDPATLHKYLYAGANPVDRIDPGGKFFGGIADMAAANSIRNTLAGIQSNIGFAIIDQIRYGGDAGLKSLVISSGLPLGFLLIGKTISVVGRSVADRAIPASRRFLPVIQRFCFVAGTPVHTPDGVKAIEDIAVGDTVLTFNEKTRRVEHKKVTRIFKREANAILNVTIRGEESEPLGVTPEHPFYARKSGKRRGMKQDPGRWIPAGELKAGDLVLRPSGDWAEVADITRRSGPVAVFNFEAADNHNYFVGRLGALVHNACTVFPNTLPQRLAAELDEAAELGVRALKIGESGFDDAINAGTVKWAVTESGELVVIPKVVDGIEISHSVLTRGAPVRAAGEADIAGQGGQYFMIEITPHSGHFQPSLESLDIGKMAFANEGVHLPPGLSNITGP